MAAGGFKTFTTGEVLTSADTNNFLMQGVLVFADATARDSAITAPVEGQVVYLKDTNAVLSYDGSSYIAVGGSSPLTTKGDLYTFSTVDARLPVGTDGFTLVADSVEATGLKWVAPAGGGISSFTLLNAGGTALTGAATITVSGISGLNKLLVVLTGASSASASSIISIRLNADSGNNYNYVMNQVIASAAYVETQFTSANAYGTPQIQLGQMGGVASMVLHGAVTLDGCDTTDLKTFIFSGGGSAFSGVPRFFAGQGHYSGASVISSVSAVSGTGNFDAGTMFIYGSVV